jgi:polyisoprenoid-binding protein YceI
MGLSTYVGRFNSFDASLEFQPAAIEQSRLTALIEIGSLDINNTDLKSDLMRAKWFNVKEYPQAIFTTLSVIQTKDAHYDFLGELNWRGVKKQVPMQVIFHGGANNLLTGK